jgi:hypothetical protein
MQMIVLIAHFPLRRSDFDEPPHEYAIQFNNILDSRGWSNYNLSEMGYVYMTPFCRGIAFCCLRA